MRKFLILLLILAMTSCLSNNKSIKSKGEIRSSTVIELSGKNYYPDSVAALKDGTLFVGSMWTGQIDMIPSNSNSPVSFIQPEAEGRTVLGLLVDEDANRLWACYWDFKRFMTVPAQLKSFDLKTGKLIKTYDYPKKTIGNDITMDGKRNIYTTCSFSHTIFRLPNGGNDLEIWCDDPVLSAGWKEGWTLNGIAWNGKSLIYLSRTDNDGFYRVSIKKDGSAGDVQKITVADTLTNMGYDGIVSLDSNTFLIAEYGTGRLTMIDIIGTNGSKRVVSTELNFPTNSVIIDNGAWVVESQLDHMLGFDKTSPEAPFLLKYIKLSSNSDDSTKKINYLKGKK